MFKYAILNENNVVKSIRGSSTPLSPPTTEDSTIFMRLTEEQKTAVQIGFTYNPETREFEDNRVPATWPITHKQFLDLFEAEEILGMKAARDSDSQIKLADLYFDSSKNIDLLDPLTVNYVGYLEMNGILQAGRAEEILSQRPAIVPELQGELKYV